MTYNVFGGSLNSAQLNCTVSELSQLIVQILDTSHFWAPWAPLGA